MDNVFSYSDFTNMSDFMHEIVMGDERKEGFKIKAFAEHIGKGQSTVYGELNKFDQNYKLGANIILQYMKFADDIRPLEWLASKMGYEIKKIEAVPDKETWEAEYVQDGSLFGKLGKAMDEGASPNDVHQIVCALKEEINETDKRYCEQYHAKNDK